jgi:hypothetical protein
MPCSSSASTKRHEVAELDEVPHPGPGVEVDVEDVKEQRLEDVLDLGVPRGDLDDVPSSFLTVASSA